MVVRWRPQGASIAEAIGATEDAASGRTARPGGTDTVSPTPPGSLSGGLTPQHRSLGGLFAVLAAVAGVTAANRAGLLGLGALASSPRNAGEGKVWLLLTSALVADKPTAASLLAFATFAVAVLIACGPRLLWFSAVAGHVGSAVGVYAVIATARAVVPSAFEGVLSLPDYGTSAMIGTWLGVLATVGWMRWPRLGPRLGVVAFCSLSAGVGWLCDSSLTFLDSEHGVAFGIGIGVASGAAWGYPRRVVREWLAMARGLARRGATVVARLGLALRQQQV